MQRQTEGLYVSTEKPRLEKIPARLGLIAGEGNFPIMLAQAARSLGVEVYTFGVTGLAPEELRRHSKEMYLLKLTEFSRLVQLCHEHGIGHIIMAGRVPHDVLLLKQFSFDKRIFKILGSLADRRADSLLKAVVDELEKENIQVLDSTMFLKGCMPEPGILTPRIKPSDEILRDIEFGYPLAKEIGRLDIGQTIAVKNGVVVAVEALEGTDKLIKRCGELGGEGIVFIKIAKPRQDMRFDVPVIGLTTIRNLASARAAALCITAHQSLFFDREEAIELAEQNRICIIAKADGK
jgi:DUF1009 family protein